MDYIQSLTELLQDAALDIRLKFVTIVLPNMEKYLTSEYILSGMSDAGSKVWIVLKRQSWISQIILLILTLISIVSILSAIYVKLTRGMCRSKARMDGKTVLITGANSGIGLATAKDLAKRGARVILGVRNMAKGVEAAKEIVDTTGNKNLVVRKLDLASLAIVRQFAREIIETEERLDVMILNAGVALTKKYLTEDNLELHMASNHFGHFLLANLLLGLMAETSATKTETKRDPEPSRIIVVSSIAHWYGKIELDNLNAERYFKSSRIYADTKLANVLFAVELDRKLKKERLHNSLTVNLAHPGPVHTNLFNNIPYYGWLIKFFVGILYYTPEEGAQTSIFLAVAEEVKKISGKYFAGCKETKMSPVAQDTKLCSKLWGKSVELVDLLPTDTIVW